ncbi:HDOD domain-containing protein [Thalassotalea atypica]|uniref:HDOD domain-containing protein n=1 Tax=Thalassotalea atypica TaxID=2054316 RepID=UPI00257372A3|nr:HDOD domain-containing protein [Thalassotalea atypica]
METQKRKREQWIDFIVHNELPALTSTARLLQKFSNDDVSSLPRLSKAILHDQALSSCLLKVANSASRIGVAPVTTVSRATVVLGIQAVKNICLTSKVIESLLKNEHLEFEVYEKIKRSMASSFYAGQLAKMMMPDYDDDTREEVYLASMLHRIGETAFWCVGAELKSPLAELAVLSKKEFEQQSKKLIGMSLNDLSLGLARHWNLGDLLIKSLDSPDSRTIEIKIIDLSDKLASYIDMPPSQAEFDRVIGEVSSLLEVNERQLRHRINQTREKSMELLDSYGAQMLNEYIKDLPKGGDFQANYNTKTPTRVNQDMAQLNVMQHLSNLTLTSSDINEFLEYTLKNTAAILNLDLCSFYLLATAKSELKLRTSFDQFGTDYQHDNTIIIERASFLFDRVLKERQPLLINNREDKAIQKFVTPQVVTMLNEGKMAIAPVMIDNNAIGLITANNYDTQENISDADFSRFTFLVQHLSMCLSTLSKRK